MGEKQHKREGGTVQAILQHTPKKYNLDMCLKIKTQKQATDSLAILVSSDSISLQWARREWIVS